MDKNLTIFNINLGYLKDNFISYQKNSILDALYRDLKVIIWEM